MEASEVGRFGTLRLMKRLEPDKVVASYPIDEEEITLGRDPTCNIRLYYETVSGIHCKLMFRERKAFLVVLGVNGVLVDGAPVFPATGPSAHPVTVPLLNNSSIEVHKKRFQFYYPPKELRATLLDTPSRPENSTPDRRRRRRTLRMSMIQSAQVFTPRPSENPRENLRILKTPIKSPFMRPEHNRRLSSPLKRGAYIPEEDEEEDEDEEEEIVLVESNHPRVVEEDRDLVILERVLAPEPEPEPEPPRQVVYPIPQTAQAPAQTPARRRPRASLHRAVLIRSAHRSALQREMEAEEEREVEEVEEIFEEVEQMQELEEDGEDERDVVDNEEQETGEQQQASGSASGWRKSLSSIKDWAFGGSPAQQRNHEGEEEEEHELPEAEYDEEEPQEAADPEPEEEYSDEAEAEVEEDEEVDAMDVEEEEPENYMPPPVTRGPFAVPARPLGKFMTPQAPRQADFGLPKNRTRGHVRYSVGGFTPGGIYGTATPGPSGVGTASGPRRVRVVEPWRVSEITVPLNDAQEEEQDRAAEESFVPPSTPRRDEPLSPSKRERLTEEERKAILQRRKSALTEPDFFGGQTPGRRLSMFPLLSPTKPSTQSMPTVEESPQVPPALTSHDTASHADLEGAEDTSILLARMKHMVEDAKRRQSMGPRPSLGPGLATPRRSGGFSLFAPEAESAPVRKVFTEIGDAQNAEEDEEEEEDVSDKENDILAGLSGPEETRQEDVEMEDEPEEEQPKASSSRSVPQAQTPRLDDLKHVFHAPRGDNATPSFQGVRKMFNQAPSAPVETPRLDGVRPMFTRAERSAEAASGVRELYQRVMATPTFEGVGKMLATPAGYEAEEQTAAEPEETETNEAEQVEPAPSPRKRGRPRKSSPRKASARRTPSRAATTPEPPSQDEKPTAEEPAPAARVTRKTRGKAAESDTDTEVQPKTTRRTRKTTPSPAPEEPVAPRSLRKTRNKTPTPTPEEPPRASSSKRRGRTPIAEEDEEAEESDPIDALHGAERAVSPEVPVADDGDSRVRRSARGKLVMQVKEEPAEKAPPPPAKTAPARSGVPRAVRGRRPAGAAAATAVPRTSSIPRGTRGAKTATLKRPATTGSTRLTAESAAAPIVGNKENTPEPDEDTPAAGTSGKAPAARSASRLATRVGVKSAGRTRAAVAEQPAEVGKSRVSRSKVAKK